MASVCGITLPFMPSPQMVTGIVSVIQARNASQLYTKYRDIITMCIDKNMEKAEELKRTIVNKARWHADMNEEACNLPEYNACATAPYRARYDVIREASVLRDRKVRALDRGQVGYRCDLDRQTQVAVLSESMGRQLDVKRQEEDREILYLDLCLSAMVQATSIGSYPGAAASALGRSGEGFTALSQQAQGRLQGGLTALGTSVGQYFNQQKDSAYRTFIEAQQRHQNNPSVYGRPVGVEGSTINYDYSTVSTGPHL